MNSLSSTSACSQKLRWIAGRLLLFLFTVAPVASLAGSADMPRLADWAVVLRTFVNERGQIDFDALARHPEGLQSAVAEIGRISPQSAPDRFPTKESILAYYINAYNALAMYNVIDSGIPESLTWPRRIGFFGLKKFSVGGEQMSLYSLENKVIRPIGDERVHFALNCMVVGCPRLPREPFTSERLNEQLDRAAKLFFSEARNLSIDAPMRVLHVSSILKFYTEDFLRDSPTLIAYINRYATSTVPADYAIEFIPYDWTVNRQ